MRINVCVYVHVRVCMCTRKHVTHTRNVCMYMYIYICTHTYENKLTVASRCHSLHTPKQ